MTKTFTQDDLIRYIYKETSAREDSEIESALICNDDLLDQYNQLKNTIQQLDKIQEMPSSEVIDKIIDHSRSLNLDSVND